MSAIVNGDRIRQLDSRAEPPVQVTPEQWADVPRMTRLIMGLLYDVTLLRRRFWPDYLEHEDVTFDATGTTVYRLPHGFRGRVRWWVTDWRGAAGGPSLVLDASTDDNTLALVSYVEGVGTIRIQGAG